MAWHENPRTVVIIAALALLVIGVQELTSGPKTVTSGILFVLAASLLVACAVARRYGFAAAGNALFVLFLASGLGSLTVNALHLLRNWRDS